MAAELSGSAELVCGAFSRDPNQSKKAGVELFDIDPVIPTNLKKLVSSYSILTLTDHIQMSRRCV